MSLPSRAFAILILLFALATAGAAPTSQPVIFNRDIRPILADTCFKCHGPDAAKRKAELRLDTRAGALKDLGGGQGAIVPGKPDESEAFRRITTDDPEDHMPPLKSGLKLTREQIDLIQRWIAQGAEYQPHWSLIKPVATTLPTVKNEQWPRNDIDRFILARLEAENLQPSPETDRVSLIRRVTLDLTGLPPTPSEVEAFVSDQSPGAYERVVDRLLASQRYGERMAMRWLDLARYADTNGYQIDTERAQWRWRDWVIDAFNTNMPFDRFTIEQLAGDLLPNPTLEQKIASGFNRNHRITLEGGVIPEEYRTEYVIDRVETTATTWLGLTMGCARCHDHKYDPITQKEFYELFAFFNNVPENGIDGRTYNSPPLIPAPYEADRPKLAELDAQVTKAEAAAAAIEPKISAGLAKWEEDLPVDAATPLRDGLVVHHPLDDDLIDAATPCRSGAWRDGDEGFTGGLLDRAAGFDGKRFIELGDICRFERTDSFSFGAWIRPAANTDGAIIARMDDTKGSQGWNLYDQAGLIHLQFINHAPDNMLTLVSTAPVSPNTWHHVFATYDGSGKGAGAKVYVDGKPFPMQVTAETLSKTIVAKVPLRIGARSPAAKFRGRIDDVRIYNRVLSPEEVATLGDARVIAKNVRPESRTPEQIAAIRELYLKTAPAEQRDVLAKRDAAKAEHQKLLDTIPNVMVMSEAMPRETHILKRGQYDQPGEKVTAAVPACLPPLAKDAPVNRLGLARWIATSDNPLTARVTVNRFWEMYFGAGIVRSTEDFGTQAQYPTHLELLDYLAIEFAKSGWDVKKMQKLIVTSSTYRQSSRITSALLEKDPENRLLARGPRVRLPAETIRDQALASSGLLVEKIGGPSVKGYQPAGIWEEVTSEGGGGALVNTGQRYVQEHGPALYRRSLYTFWKRTVPPPTLTVFDAPTREICTVRRSRTNTPLQALALMNDTIFVESARKLAERAMSEVPAAKPADRITHAFRLVVSRVPDPAELKILVEDFNTHLATYFSDPDAATKLLSVGESPRNPSFDPRELAAYTAVSSVILNMDQTITRE